MLRRLGQGGVSGGGERVQGRVGGGVVDRPDKTVGKAERGAEEVEHMLLEFGDRGPAAPDHPVHVQRRGHRLRQDTGRGPGDGEVGVESRMIPVGGRGKDQAIDVGEQRVERLPLFRKVAEARSQVPGPDVGEDGELPHAAEVVGDPVRHIVGVAPDLLSRHVV